MSFYKRSNIKLDLLWNDIIYNSYLLPNEAYILYCFKISLFFCNDRYVCNSYFHLQIHGLIRRFQGSSDIGDKVFPTVRNIHSEIAKDDEFPRMSVKTLFYVLKHMGFRFEDNKRARNALLLDEPEIANLRSQYLHSLNELREQGVEIFFTDESYIHQSHTRVSIKWLRYLNK